MNQVLTLKQPEGPAPVPLEGECPTAAMLTGGASGGWGMAEALKSRPARLIETRPCSSRRSRGTSDADANAGEGSGESQILPLPAFGRDIERVRREALS